MELKQVIVELRNGEMLRLFRPYAELYHSITGKELPEKEQVLPGFELNIQDKQMRVVVDPRRIAVVFGQVPNAGYCVDNSLGVFRKVSELVKVPPLVRLGVRSTWIRESKVSFEDLVSAHRRVVYTSNTLSDTAVDIGASFVLADGTRRATVAFGPMKLTQLRTFFLFTPSDLPEVVTFADVDYFEELDKVDATAAMLRDFVRRGLEYAGERAEELTKILRL